MSAASADGILLDYAQDKISVLDEHGRFTYVSAASERILGYAPAELEGTVSFEYIHPEDVEGVRETFADLIERSEPAQETRAYRFQAADGEWVWLESRMSNVTDERLEGYVVSSRDVTDRVDAERDRREITNRLQEISATTGDVLWLFDGDWSEVLFVNPAYESVYGHSVAALEADPESFLEVIHPDDVPMVETAMDRLANGVAVDLEFRVNPDRDYKVWIWAQAHPIVVDDTVVRIAGFSRDVTDRHRRERQLFVMDTLLRHNLRNDLNVVIGHADDIEAAHPGASDHTAVIRRTSQELLASADKERTIIEAITERGAIERAALGRIVRDAVGTVRERYPDAEITVSVAEHDIEVYTALETALVELLENGIVHQDGTTARVDLRTAETETGVTITVRDEAPTIPRMDAAVLTGDHDMDGIYHSSGLGLWLVYWTVDCCGGTIDLDAGGDRGNEIVITLPTPLDDAPIAAMAAE